MNTCKCGVLLSDEFKICRVCDDFNSLDKIICGDSSIILDRVKEESIDLVVTSPPYNFGMEYDEHNDKQDWDDYKEKLFLILRGCAFALKPSGRMAINIQPAFSQFIPIHHEITTMLRQFGLLWRAEILWDKQNYNCKTTAWGSWQSPSNPYVRYTHEFIEVFSKGDMKKEGDKEKIDIKGEDFSKWTLGKWEIPPETNMKEFGHPAMFPEEIPRRLIQLYSYVGDIVLDPFCGVGTTCVVAKKFKRRYLGIEKSEKYCETARKRLDGRLFW